MPKKRLPNFSQNSTRTQARIPMQGMENPLPPLSEELEGEPVPPQPAASTPQQRKRGRPSSSSSSAAAARSGASKQGPPSKRENLAELHTALSDLLTFTRSAV